MKKKTIIIIASVTFTVILLGILIYRLCLINMDTSGLYELKDDSFIFFVLTFLPEISIILAILASNMKKSLGVILTGAAGLLTIAAFLVELFIKIVKSDVLINRGSVPPPCMPWLNIPVFIIILILFIVKFHIFTIPNEIKIKRKRRKRRS